MFTSVPEYVFNSLEANPDARPFQIYSNFAARYGKKHTSPSTVRRYCGEFKNGDFSSLNQEKTIPIVSAPDNLLPNEVDMTINDHQAFNHNFIDSDADNYTFNINDRDSERMSQDGDNVHDNVCQVHDSGSVDAISGNDSVSQKDDDSFYQSFYNDSDDDLENEGYDSEFDENIGISPLVEALPPESKRHLIMYQHLSKFFNKVNSNNLLISKT